MKIDHGITEPLQTVAINVRRFRHSHPSQARHCAAELAMINEFIGMNTITPSRQPFPIRWERENSIRRTGIMSGIQ
jgi:hypothetical protein